ncbi:MAG: HAMP domain-containing histidine kinase [Verrucomicrobia bacterium]|nr:HAMP domain-containing histidine kinase [Verrucomicrobiota bacterium]MBU4247031.1 HAMP domain-containing histidine kinase [Verrucomicrobiota bacterium]MBU4290319.1 HAMP domain-containing histidine kinase [Verrucomicrobiota bacterium]MCG2681781.1 HAMP domain-containing histidine kinase [Kiritimatiellia bacterium]
MIHFMNRRAILGYWLLLFVPTVVVGAAAFRLIRHEGERITAQARSTELDRVRAIADNVRLAVSSVEDELGESLCRIPSSALAETLPAWERSNPLVRNVFIWDAKKGLQMPSQQGGWTAEERRFIVRYDALFSGRIPWLSAASETNGTVRGPVRVGGAVSSRVLNTEPLAESNRPSDFIRQVEQIRAGGRQLAATARPQDADGISDRESPNSAWMGGWIPWFTENRLYVLGWVQRDSRSPVYGIELELATLLSRLMTVFPSTASDGAVYALLDDEGKIVCQVGRMELKSDARPDMAAALAPYLPHWSVGVYLADGGMLQAAGRSFVLLAGLLLAIVVVAILAGGSLLTWQAQRHLADALQKTSFVSNISHELKTPLTSIRIYAELLSEGRITDAEKTQKYLQVISAESQRLTRLVNNVLDFSRMEQGKKKYHRESIEGVDFVRQFIEAHRLRLGEAGLTVHAKLPEEPLWMPFDRDALEQVLLNLVDNVVKYANEGGELQITLERKPGHCRLAVMDRGPGISPSHRTRIFDKFYRVDDSLTARQPGSGLGLSIARRLLRDLGGDLTFEPRAGGGSCFVACLPCAAPPDGPVELASP